MTSRRAKIIICSPCCWCHSSHCSFIWNRWICRGGFIFVVVVVVVVNLCHFDLNVQKSTCTFIFFREKLASLRGFIDGHSSTFSQTNLYSCLYTLAIQVFLIIISDVIIQNAISIVNKLLFYIYKENSAVRIPSEPPQSLHLQPPKQTQPSMQRLHAPRALIPLLRAQTNFSCFEPLSLSEPAAAIKDIHLSA